MKTLHKKIPIWNKFVKKQIQTRKDDKDFNDDELRNAQKNIKEQIKVVHQTNYPEEARLLKNMKNQYTKIEAAKKKAFETGRHHRE